MTELAVPDAGAATTPATALSRGSPSAVSPGILIGYARCSTERQDLTAQRDTLRGLGVAKTGSTSITA